MTSAEANLPGGGGRDAAATQLPPTPAAGPSSGRVSKQARRALGQHTTNIGSVSGQGMEKRTSPLITLSAANFWNEHTPGYLQEFPACISISPHWSS